MDEYIVFTLSELDNTTEVEIKRGFTDKMAALNYARAHYYDVVNDDRMYPNGLFASALSTFNGIKNEK